MVPRGLVVARTLKADDSESPFFLMVVDHPTVAPHGAAKQLWPGKNALLEPGNIDIEVGEDQQYQHVLTMGTIGADLHSVEAMAMKDRSPSGYLARNVVFNINEDYDLYKPVVLPAVTTKAERQQFFSNDAQRSFEEKMWTSEAAMEAKVDKAAIVWDVPDVGDTNQEVVYLRKILPLPRPALLPPGILGDASLGVEGLRTLCHHHFSGDPIFTDWLDHPCVTEYLEGAKTHPDAMVSNWYSREWAKDSLTEENPKPAWRSKQACNLVLSLERTLAYRIHRSFLLGTDCMGTRTRDQFLRYSERAIQGLLTADTYIGAVDQELAGDLWYLRYPDAFATLNFQAFTEDSSVAPSTRQYLRLKVPVTQKDKWEPLALETKADAEARIADAQVQYEESDLAKQRRAAAASPQYRETEASQQRGASSTAQTRSSNASASANDEEERQRRRAAAVDMTRDRDDDLYGGHNHRERQVSWGDSKPPARGAADAGERTPSSKRSKTQGRRDGLMSNSPSLSSSDYYQSKCRSRRVSGDNDADSDARTSLVEFFTEATKGTSKKMYSWKVLDPPRKNPTGFLKMSGLLFFLDPTFDGFYLEGRKERAIARNMEAFPPKLRRGFREDCLAGTDKEALDYMIDRARSTIEHANLQMTSRDSRRAAPPVTPLSFDKFPKAMMNAFRECRWWCTNQGSEPPLSDRFSAFALLFLLPNRAEASMQMPADGISFGTAMRVMESGLWMLLDLVEPPVLRRRGMGEQQQAIIEETPLLRTYEWFLDLMRQRETEDFDSFRAFWDSSAHSKNACMFWALQRLNEMWRLFLLLVDPYESDESPFYAAYEKHQRDERITPEVPALDLYYKGVAPYGTSRAHREEPNILGALVTWEEEVRRQLELFKTQDPSRIKAAPTGFLIAAPAASATQSRRQRDGGDSTKEKGKKKDDSTKQYPSAKASQAFFRWGPNATEAEKAKSPGFIARLLPKDSKNMFPAAVDSNGNPQAASDSKLVCFPFAMENQEGCKQGSGCKFVHLDAATPDADKTKYAFIKAFIAHDKNNGKIVLTEAGKAAAGL